MRIKVKKATLVVAGSILLLVFSVWEKGGSAENVTNLSNVVVDIDARRPDKRLQGVTTEELKKASLVAMRIVDRFLR